MRLSWADLDYIMSARAFSATQPEHKMPRIACHPFILQLNTIVSDSDSSSFHYKPSYLAQPFLNIIYHNVRIQRGRASRAHHNRSR